MAALDAVNARYRCDALRIVATGLERSWGTQALGTFFVGEEIADAIRRTWDDGELSAATARRQC